MSENNGRRPGACTPIPCEENASLIAWENFGTGDHRVMCPACGCKTVDKTMGVTVARDGHGKAQCFRCGHVEVRDNRCELSEAERKAFTLRMDALRKQHDHERRQLQACAATAAALRWAAAVPAQAHPYLTRKGLQAHGTRIEAGGTLLIPLRDTKGQLHSLQAITADEAVSSMPNGRTQGCYFAMGVPSGKLVICEGFAAGARIRQETGHAIAVAVDSCDLLSVAKALRGKFPCLTLVLAADAACEDLGDPGLAAVKEAAHAVGGLIEHFTPSARAMAENSAETSPDGSTTPPTGAKGNA